MKKYLLFVYLLFVGCSPSVIYEEVKIPIKCNIHKTQKPIYSNDIEQDITNILIYNEVLQNDLEVCTNQ